MPKKKLENIANFLYEAGILQRTPRSGFHFLGTGNQTVAEHLNRVIVIGYTLASLEKDIDMLKVFKMCMLHDMAEGRTSDLNYVHQKYVTVEEKAAINDFSSPLPFGDDMKSILMEYEERKSKESILAKDADNLEWILSLKEQVDIGNTRAITWIDSALKRLKTKVAQDIGKQIVNTKSDNWWFGDKEDRWWVDRNNKKRK